MWATNEIFWDCGVAPLYALDEQWQQVPGDVTTQVIQSGRKLATVVDALKRDTLPVQERALRRALEALDRLLTVVNAHPANDHVQALGDTLREIETALYDKRWEEACSFIPRPRLATVTDAPQEQARMLGEEIETLSEQLGLMLAAQDAEESTTELRLASETLPWLVRAWSAMPDTVHRTAAGNHAETLDALTARLAAVAALAGERTRKELEEAGNQLAACFGQGK